MALPVIQKKRYYWTIFINSAILLFCLINKFTNGLLLKIAEHWSFFFLYQALILVILAFVFFNFAKICFGPLQKPGQVLNFFSNVDPGLRRALEIAKEPDTNLEPVYEKIYNAICWLRQESIIHLLVIFAAIILLLSMLTMTSSSYFGDDVAFKGLSANAGLFKHLYFVSVTIVTLGYGDICAANWYGYSLIFIVCIVTIFLLIFGIGFAISHWYYIVSRVESDLRNIRQ